MTNRHTDRDRNVTQSSRNQMPPDRDTGSRPLRRGGPIWINLFGRDWVVRKPTKLGFTGTAMGSLGVVCVVWGSVQAFDPVRVGVGLFLAGVILMCFKDLRTQNLAADEIFNIGRERGEADVYDEAYKEGYEEGMAMGERRRPHVVAPLPQCPSCGTTTALRSVASVADRG